METKQLKVISDISEILLLAQVAAPIIFGVATVIKSLFKGLTGKDTDISGLADDLAKKLHASDTWGKAEVARLKAML